MASPAQPRPRRRPGALRGEITDAARELFLENGYAGTSMRQIADRADTTQGLLYRHFTGKAAVFEAAVLALFEAILTDYLTEWQAHTTAELSNEELFADFNRRVIEFASTHRQDLLVVLATAEFEADDFGAARERFAEVVTRIVAQVRAQSDARGWSEIDLEVAARSTIAMVVGTALLEPWMFRATARRPARNRTVKELTEYQLHATQRARL